MQERTMNNMLKLLMILAIICLAILQLLFSQGIIAKPSTVQVCPVNAIQMINGKAVINPELCIGCRRCVDGIPGIASQSKVIASSEDSTKVLPLSQPPRRDSINTTNSMQNRPASPPSRSKVIRYIVDSSKCIRCELCVTNCPAQAITMQGDKAVIDQTKCISCGICVNGNTQDFSGCPVGAISRN